jgi:AAA15 family ATPase/GTPase
MIIEFNLENFRSFHSRKTLSMEAAPISDFSENIAQVGNHKLLTSAVIYGANSSGKSNLLRGMSVMKNIILNNFEKSSVSSIANAYDPFLLNTTTFEKPTHYEIIFIAEQIKYRYGFAVANDTISSEWLFETKKKTEKALFIRIEDGIEVMPSFHEGKHLEEKTRDNALFLSVVDQFNGVTAKRIIKWFRNFNVISGLKHEDYRAVTFAMLDNPQMKPLLTSYYTELDLGFQDIKVLKKEMKAEDLPSDVPEDLFKQLVSDLEGKKMVTLKTLHTIFDEKGEEKGIKEFDTRRQESSGTNKMIDLSGPIFKVLKDGGTLVVDELDAKLHPLLTLSIIKLFQNKDINIQNAQLIFATHDTNILSMSQLRRDQIYFVEKNNYGASDLYSLVEYNKEGKVRKDRSFEKDYINGRYGAIPYFGNFNTLLEKWHGK